jgi:hypothetical protein
MRPGSSTPDPSQVAGPSRAVHELHKPEAATARWIKFPNDKAMTEIVSLETPLGPQAHVRRQTPYTHISRTAASN